MHSPENILVAHLAGDGDGQAVAEHYVARRSIPTNNLVAVEHSGSWTKYNRFIGAEVLDLLDQIKAAIDSSATPIVGIQLAGDWPVQTSHWRVIFGSGERGLIFQAAVRMLQPLLEYGRGGSDDLSVPSQFRPLKQSFFTGSISSPWMTDEYRYRPSSGASTAWEVHPTEPKKVYAVAALPCFNRPAQDLTIPWMNDILSSEGEHEDFGTVILTDSTNSSKPSEIILSEAVDTDYPLDDVYYRTASGGPQQRLYNGEVAPHNIAGVEDYYSPPGMGLYSLGNVDDEGTTYWREGTRPAKPGDQTFRSGAIATYTQSLPFRNGSALIMHWDYPAQLAEDVAHDVLGGRDSQARVRLRHPEHPSLLWAFWPRTEKSGLQSAQVIVDGDTLTLLEDGDPVYTSTTQGKTIEQFWDPLQSWMRSNGWLFDWGRTHGPTSRGYEAIMAGAAATWGSAEEPGAYNDGTPDGVIGGLWKRGWSLSELQWWKLAKSQYAHETHEYYGDLLYRPFLLPGEPIVAYGATHEHGAHSASIAHEAGFIEGLSSRHDHSAARAVIMRPPVSPEEIIEAGHLVRITG